MKRRWKLAIAAAALVAGAVIVPVAYIEGGCRTPPADRAGAPPYRSILPPADRRPLAATFLTYPEWHIVYEAESYARHLDRGAPPSAFPFGRHIASFWTSYCTVNQLTMGSPTASDYKLTIYTIGISYTAELLVKAAYERTVGRVFEWLSGWTSADDRHAAIVQRRYGAFLHETPWFRFPFGQALRDEWRTAEPVQPARHWERRFALSAEYGVKALYAKAIDAATGATVGHDETTLRFVARAAPQALRSLDPRIVPIGSSADGLTIAQAPRYQQFNDILGKLADARIDLMEIAGNGEIFVTLLLPATAAPPGKVRLSLPIDRPGWRRVGIVVPVRALTATLRQVRQSGGEVEHVYDY